MILTAKLKSAIVAAAVTAVGAGLLLQSFSINQIRGERDDLLRRVAEMSEARTPIPPDVADVGGLASLRQTSEEVTRSRGVGARSSDGIAPNTSIPPTEVAALPSSMLDRYGEPLIPGGGFVPLAQLGNAGSSSPEASVTTMLWSALSRNLQLFKNVREPLSEELIQYLAQSDPRMLNEEIALERTGSLFDGVKAVRIASNGAAAEDPHAREVVVEFENVMEKKSSMLTMTLRGNDGVWRVASPKVPER